MESLLDVNVPGNVAQWFAGCELLFARDLLNSK